MITPDELIKSRRRSIGFTVTGEGRLIVRAPLFATKAQIERALVEKAGWIEKKQAEARARSLLHPPHAYREGELFPYLGRDYALRFCPAFRVTLEENGGLLLCPEQKRTPEQTRAALTAWYKKQARPLFSARLDFYAGLMKTRYAALRLSSALGRWGSCGPQNSINLNWRLIAAPPSVLDYVVVHELAHTLHKDHGKAFWKTVAALLPDYKVQKKWLKDNAHILQL